MQLADDVVGVDVTIDSAYREAIHPLLSKLVQIITIVVILGRRGPIARTSSIFIR